MKIRAKTTLMLTLPLIIVGLISIFGLVVLHQKFNALSDDLTDKFSATLELEINLKEASKDINYYLSQNDKVALVSYQDNLADYERYVDILKSKDLTDIEVTHLQELNDQYLVMRILHEKLIAKQNEKKNAIERLKSILNDRIENLLDEHWQPLAYTEKDNEEKMLALLEIEINMHELISATRGYLLTQSEFLRGRVEDSIIDAENWSNTLKVMSLGQQENIWLGELSKYLEMTKDLTEEVLKNEDELQALMEQHAHVSEKIDHILDEKLQEDIMYDLVYAEEQLSKFQTILTYLITGLIIFSIALVTVLIKRIIVEPIYKLKSAADDIVLGRDDVFLEYTANDEIGGLSQAFKKIIAHNENLSNAASRIGDGKFETEINLRSDQDKLSKSLVQMRDNLKLLQQDNDSRLWVQEQISSITHGSQEFKLLSDLLQFIIMRVSKATESGHGVLYIDMTHTDNTAPNQTYKLMASYGHDERKRIANEVKQGEGLLGQCALEKKSILLTDVPSDYIQINSGLGASTPLNIYAIPLKHENALIGVLEIASFKPYDETKKSFINSLVMNLGIIISNLIAHDRTHVLLDETKSLNQTLESQSEELRATNEELEEKARILKESEEELQTQSEELRVMNEELEEKTEFLEQQKSSLERAQEELEERAQDLAMSGKYKSEFLANMSHELRTPLNSLLILSKKLADNRDGNLTEKQVKSADIIYKGGQELLNLINDILDLSKVESGKMQIHYESVNIQSACKSVTSLFSHIAEQKNIALHVEIDPNVPECIESDEQRLMQIIRNLLSNAIKFTKEGEVRLHVSTDINSPNLISWSVIDTGIGIPADKQYDIFEAFQQAEGTTSRKYGGTGLGLAISKALADLLGGKISVKSTINQGSTFTYTCPIRNADSISHADISSEAFENKAPKVQSDLNSVLIVEDDEIFANSLSEIAAEQGYKIHIALDAKSALDITDNHDISAIILDLNLPDMPGEELLEKWEESGLLEKAPVHIISARDDIRDIAKSHHIEFLQKPVEDHTLVNMFKEVSAKTGVRPKVLIIEDDDATAEAIISSISEASVVTDHVMSAADAIKKIKKPDMTASY